MTTTTDDAAVMAWTASRLTADPEPAYGSASLRVDPVDLEQAELGTVYALPRLRVALDWRRACADG